MVMAAWRIVTVGFPMISRARWERSVGSYLGETYRLAHLMTRKGGWRIWIEIKNICT